MSRSTIGEDRLNGLLNTYSGIFKFLRKTLFENACKKKNKIIKINKIT